MAGARAAASLSLTIGVAFVTVLIVGGILAGPTIIDCSHQPSSFGACLRDHLDHARLVPARDEPSQAPVLSSETSAPSVPPVSPSPPGVAENGEHSDGWLDARANEYEPPAPSALQPPPLPALPELGTPPAVSSLTVAAIEPPAPPDLPPLVAPAPLPALVDVSSSAVAAIDVAPVPPPVPQRPATTSTKPRAEIRQTATRPVRVAKAIPRPAPKPSVRTFKNDPRFPNVTVLSPPATGANSSFVTLNTH